MIEASAHLLSFILFKRAGVRLSGTQTEIGQHLENLPALDFKLARKIVDSNLTHPPLFTVIPKPLVAHSYLSAMAW